MQRLARNATIVVVATVALLIPGIGAASADAGDSEGSVLSGNNLDLGLNLPATVCGLGVSILGIANSEGCDVENTSVHQGGSTGDSNGSVLSGNNVDANLDIAATVCSVAVGVLGIARTDTCKVKNTHISSGGSTGDSNGSVLSGNNAGVDAFLPVTVCGNAVSVVGISDAKCKVSNLAIHHGGSTGDSNGSVLSGNNLDAFIDAPITVCGNAVAVVGIAHAKCKVRNIAVDVPPTGTPTSPTPTGTPTTPSDEHRPPPKVDGDLPTTGSAAILALPIGLALLAGGVLLYRRFRNEPEFGPVWE